MKRVVSIMVCTIGWMSIMLAQPEQSATVVLQQQEIEEILSSQEPYAFFGLQVCSMVHDLPTIQKYADKMNSVEQLNSICARIDNGKTTAPAAIVEAALQEAAQCLISGEIALSHAVIQALKNNLELYDEMLKSGSVLLTMTVRDERADNSDLRVACFGCTQVGPFTLGTGDATSLTFATDCNDRLVIDQNGAVAILAPSSGAALTVNGNLSNAAVFANGNGSTTAPALILQNNPASDPTDFLVTIDSAQVVKQSSITIDDILFVGCQPGPIMVGTSDATSLTLATDGCSNARVVIDQFGAVTISMPSAGDALTVNGNVVLPAANGTGTQGLLELGGANPSTTNIHMYEFGSRNLFVGNDAGNTSLTGSDNVGFGSNVVTGLTDENNVVAFGHDAQAVGSDNVIIGTEAEAEDPLSIALGSADSTSSAWAPIAEELNAIAIGSASGALDAAYSDGDGAISLGGADGTFSGAIGDGARSVALGVNATASTELTIVLGSASGTAGGNGPLAGNYLGVSNPNAIGIGSAHGSQVGAIGAGLAAIALGGSDGLFAGARADGHRAISIGVGANGRSFYSILIGSSGTDNSVPCTFAVGTGCGPTSVESNVIGIGSANGSKRGANPINSSCIAIGGSDGVFAGPSTVGQRNIAIGTNANSTGASGTTGQISLGSSSGVTGGSGPNAGASSGIAIGSGNSARPGAVAGGAQSVAIGGASSTVSGASATGARSVAIGNGAATAQADAVILGNIANSAVYIGIGTTTPSAKIHVVETSATNPVALFDVGRVGIGSTVTPLAKLHVVQAAGTPVVQFDAGAATLASAPVFINLTTSAGTTLVLTGANQLALLVSGAQYKENIRPLDDSSAIYAFKPVRFDYLNEGGKDLPGFSADQVQTVDATLVNVDELGAPRSIRKECIQALAIKELQNHRQELDQQSATLNQRSAILAQLKNFMDHYARAA